MQDQIQMVHNFSFVQLKLNGWTVRYEILLNLLSVENLFPGKHVVFGSVVEGMDIIKKVEGFGSRSGKTSAKIVIDDCGESSE